MPQTSVRRGDRTADHAAGRAGASRRVDPHLRRVREYPKAPMPAQHQEPPGIEAKLHPRPKYLAPNYKGASKLVEKVAVITGGDSGIGRAVAVLYAREGAKVAIIYKPEEETDARETERAVKDEGSEALLLPGDITSSDFCREAIDRVIDEYGKVDILVNNAAVQKDLENLEDLSEEQWDRTFRTNIYGYFYMVKAVLPHLKPGAAIVNTGSITGLEGSKKLVDYSATKGAIHAFTKSLAQNLVEREIRVNCVAPGPVWTPLNPVSKPAEEVPEFGADTPMKRPAQPEEIAPTFVFLASNVDSSYMTGEVISLLGGDTTAA